MATTRTQLAACNLCEAICGIELTITDGPDGPAVTGVRGNPDDPLSRGHICPKGVAMADVYADPDRLRTPVRRVRADDGTDTWEPIGWEEALDLVADRLSAISTEHGRLALGSYVGNPNAHSLGAQTHLPLLLRSLRTPNLFSASSVDQLPHQLVAHLLYGHQLLIPVPDIDRTQCLVIFGGNPMASNGSLMTVPDFPGRLREMSARGGRLVVFDPRRTETAKAAEKAGGEHVFVRPGTDAFVLLAMLHVVFTDELVAVPEYVDGVSAVREAVADFTPERAEAVSGVPASTIRRITTEYVASGAGAVYGRMGVSTQAFGTVCQWAVQCLNLITGNFDREGGVMFPEPAIDIVGRGIVGRGHIGKWSSRVRGLPEVSGELPSSVMAEEMLTPGDGRIRGFVTVAGNPVLSTPDGRRLAEALSGLDFMVSIDFYINETTRHADVILPPASALEREQYDLVFHNFGVRNTARYTPAVFPKAADARQDWEILRDLALRMNRRIGSKQGWQAWAKGQVRARTSPTMLLEVLLRTGKSGVTLRKLKASPQGVDLGPLRPTMPARLKTRSKRIDLAQPMILEDLARLAAADQPSADELVLIGRRHKQDCNSWLHNSERLTKGRRRHHLFMNPDDLASRSLVDGAMVQVSSRVGKVEVEVLATDDVMPGVVSLPHGYGHGVPGVRLEHAQSVPGPSINDLTDPELLDVSGNAALSGVPVQVSAVG